MDTVAIRSVTVMRVGVVPSVINFSVIIAAMGFEGSVTTGPVSVAKDGMANTAV